MTSILCNILYMLALLIAKRIEEISVSSNEIVMMDELHNEHQHPKMIIEKSANLSVVNNFNHINYNTRNIQNIDSSIDDIIVNQKCGGILKTSNGIIQTPNFPKKFILPIQCVWIIDASELMNGPNITIVIYLTQLYILSGLKFTEYMYYSDDYKVPSNHIYELNEDDVTKIKILKFTSQYLEIKFTLRTLDGTHLRALDHLLDVYGFNITYEVDTIKSYQCNTLQCRFLGHCYAKHDFTSYFCSCFPGFSGPDCGEGPLCEKDSELNICENGGTCKHIGDASVTCLCPTGFMGKKCEIVELNELTNGCSPDSTLDCHQKCLFTENLNSITTINNPCKCNNSNNKYNNNKEILTPAGILSNRNGEQTRYEITIRLGTNLTIPSTLSRSSEKIERRPNENNPQNILEKHMNRILRNFNITKINDLELIADSNDGLNISFHFIGIKSDSDKVREIIYRTVERGRLGNITLVSNFHLVEEIPMLDIQSITLNQKSPIREESEIILSCVAQGSSKMIFHWYKDGVFVNASKATRDIWTVILPPETDNIYTSVLGILKTDRLDEGSYTCKVTDWGIQRCRSLHLKVQTPPQLRVDPASVTLYRGESLRVRCLSTENDRQRYGQLGYSWTKNGALFQSDPNTVLWEDLYPDGSILKIKNIQKSAEFTCIVSNSIAPVSKSVYITVIDKGTVELCKIENTFGIRWRLSAPGPIILADCPKHFHGQSKRICEQRDINKSIWLTPDFSDCKSDQMINIYNEFRALTLGYQKTNCSAVLKACLEYAMRRHTNFLPGEAGFLMDLLQEVEKYLKVKGTHLEREMASEIILHILDKIMQNVFALNNQQQIQKLQLLTQSAALNRETIAASQLATSTSSSSVSSSAVSSSISSTSSITGGSSSASITGSSSGVLTSTAADSSLSLDRLNSFRIYTTTVRTLPFNLRIYGDDLFSDQLFMEISLTNNLLDVLSNTTIFASVISYKNLTGFLPKTYFTRKSSDDADIDYKPASRVIVTWLFQSNRSNDNFVEPLNLPLDAGHVEITFQHESITKTNDWSPVCGHDSRATFEATWRTDLCITKNLMENITRCICPLSGTFVVLLAKKSYNTSIARGASSSRPIFVIISCGCCFLQSCTAFAFLIPILYNRKCCITFLKMQFCTSTSTVMAIYLLGFLKLLPQDWHGIISSTLASLMLLGISTLVAITLVIQSELVPKKLQMGNISSNGGIRGAICISWLLPILFAICSPLIYTIIGKWPLYWWLEYSSSGFILYTIVEILFICLFILLFVTLLRKLLYIMKKHDKHNTSILRRIGLLYRTGIILFLKLSTDSLFLVYLNMTSNLITSHIFGVCCILLGFSILFCFVIKAEYNLRPEPINKTGNKTNIEENFCSGSINSPLSFYAKHDVEKDNESGPPSSGSTTKIPLTILSASRCSIERLQGKSLDTFLGVIGSTGGCGTTNSTGIITGGGSICSGINNSNTSGKIIVGDKTGICDISLHEIEPISNKIIVEQQQQIRGYSTISSPPSMTTASSSSSCCNILGTSTTKRDEPWEHEINDSRDFYDTYQGNQTKCTLPESHEFVGVETLDILQGVSPDSIIGIRANTVLNTNNTNNCTINKNLIINNNNNCKMKLDNKTILSSSNLKIQTPKTQKRVTIEEPIKIINNNNNNNNNSNNSNSNHCHHHHQQQQQQPLHIPPIITITSSERFDSNDEPIIETSSSPSIVSINQDQQQQPSSSITVSNGIVSSTTTTTTTTTATTATTGITHGTNNNLQTTIDDDPIDGMLDRISHDLDYLLNRTSEIPTSNTLNRRKGNIGNNNIVNNSSCSTSISSSTSIIPTISIVQSVSVSSSTASSTTKTTSSSSNDDSNNEIIVSTCVTNHPMHSSASSSMTYTSDGVSLSKITTTKDHDNGHRTIPPPPLPPTTGITTVTNISNLLTSHSRSIHEVIIEESEQE